VYDAQTEQTNAEPAIRGREVSSGRHGPRESGEVELDRHNKAEETEQRAKRRRAAGPGADEAAGAGSERVRESHDDTAGSHMSQTSSVHALQIEADLHRTRKARIILPTHRSLGTPPHGHLAALPFAHLAYSDISSLPSMQRTHQRARCASLPYIPPILLVAELELEKLEREEEEGRARKSRVQAARPGSSRTVASVLGSARAPGRVELNGHDGSIRDRGGSDLKVGALLPSPVVAVDRMEALLARQGYTKASSFQAGGHRHDERRKEHGLDSLAAERKRPSLINGKSPAASDVKAVTPVPAGHTNNDVRSGSRLPTRPKAALTIPRAPETSNTPPQPPTSLSGSTSLNALLTPDTIAPGPNQSHSALEASERMYRTLSSSSGSTAPYDLLHTPVGLIAHLDSPASAMFPSLQNPTARVCASDHGVSKSKGSGSEDENGSGSYGEQSAMGVEAAWSSHGVDRRRRMGKSVFHGD
jgi:hypothetical protein